MNASEKHLAAIHGEALAARVVADMALRLALAAQPHPSETLAVLGKFLDETLNISGPAAGDDGGERNTMVREVARLRAQESLDAIAGTMPRRS